MWAYISCGRQPICENVNDILEYSSGINYVLELPVGPIDEKITA